MKTSSFLSRLGMTFVAVTVIAIASCKGVVESGKAKVVHLTAKDDGSTVKLDKGDSLEIKLEAQLGTGYSWEVTKNDKRQLVEALLVFKSEGTVEKGDAKSGTQEIQVFRLDAKAPGSCDLELSYMRPFDKEKDKEKKADKTFKVSVQIAGAK